ncbi:MAG: molecular chaperone HtpG [Alphaproteobacteria bacterium]|nr:molecular chaperone HtpG [Alphaproteobacteria bacterium]MBV8549082.1 molecular chaperone HtpG [Alphaproteobacteria bacterium]
MTETRMEFRAEVSRLLDIVVHSLYSDKEIFLRELISNASDACDKLRYEGLTQPELLGDDTDFKVKITLDKKARTLTVGDNGIGMTRDELVENLGTIARSGTGKFLEQLSGRGEQGSGKAATNLIGQFGVGFYAAFMVAQMVEVKSRRAGSTEAWCWRSDGKGEFAVEEDVKPGRGTEITLYLRQGEDEFLEAERLRHIIGKYSDHIAIPILLGEEDEPANRAGALWLRNKSDITPEQYREFYHHVAHAFDDPTLTIHWRAEGKLEYTGLLFVPGMKPFDLFDPQRRHGVKLFVKRVFITDHAEGLLPPWLRFLRGVVDSEDLPLNVSREMLQNNPMLSHIKRGVTRRVLGDLIKFAADATAYNAFWGNFGAVLKEGLYEDADSRADLLKLLRCYSTHDDGLTSMADYVSRMKEGQDEIYFLCGESVEKLKKNPHLEGYRAKGVEVLLLTDTVDDFWPNAVDEYEGKKFKSVTRSGNDLGKITGSDDKAKKNAEDDAQTPTLVALLKLTLGDAVKDVRTTERLTESPVCLVADEGDLDIHLERFLKQHNQIKMPSKRILEINAHHPLIAKMAERAAQSGASDALADYAWLLLDQARLIDGETLPDVTAFAARLSKVLIDRVA